MKYTVKKIPLFLSQKEIENLIKNVRTERHKLGLYLMSHGGLRVSEMCNLKVADIHLQRNFMIITGKGNKQRVVPIR
jgi:integrase/recombinase XerD